MTRLPIALATLLLGLAAPALAERARPTHEAIRDLDTQDMRWTGRNCWLPASAHYRVGLLRDANTERGAAVTEVNGWLQDRWTTGSHVKRDYHPIVEQAYDFANTHRDLNPNALYSYGYYACKLKRAAKGDGARLRAGEDALMPALEACQKKFGAPLDLRKVRECVAQEPFAKAALAVPKGAEEFPDEGTR